MSRALFHKFDLLPYAVALNDLHNFHVPIDVYKSFFIEDFFTRKFPLKAFDIHNFYNKWYTSMEEKFFDTKFVWKEKHYPETRDEYVKVLDDCLTLCEENNIRPILIRTPATKNYRTAFNEILVEEFSSIIEQAYQKHPSMLFVDGWNLKDFTYEHFRDHQHLNRHGAAKFSTYLNDFIEGLEFNYYKDLNNFHNHLNDFSEELDFRNHFKA